MTKIPKFTWVAIKEASDTEDGIITNSYYDVYEWGLFTRKWRRLSQARFGLLRYAVECARERDKEIADAVSMNQSGPSGPFNR